MEKPYADIASRLRWHRERMGLTQSQYAEKAGLKRAQLNNWESGDYQVGLAGARALRKTYGLSLDFIYEGDEQALDMTLRKELLDNPIDN
ncbi:helix-turn-helix domain-containing protein [Pseudophaeobacter sp.]|uniref:helix-turn-helix domain-containing protein n=1 Tax=Pseudophaeobacter sp. TaxID=1971739 RepID=UPI003A96ACB8